MKINTPRGPMNVSTLRTIAKECTFVHQLYSRLGYKNGRKANSDMTCYFKALIPREYNAILHRSRDARRVNS